MQELKLNSGKIFELGEYIAKFLHDNGLDGDKELTVKVNKTELRKIDEDLFYRNNKEGTDFEPAGKEVNVKYHNLIIKFVLDSE